ncbi:MAG: hypothetical protein HQL59_10385 [Magnetococcales bacterium]|nr:hypothetical protein [Magnetococcales bacterium]
MLWKIFLLLLVTGGVFLAGKRQGGREVAVRSRSSHAPGSPGLEERFSERSRLILRLAVILSSAVVVAALLYWLFGAWREGKELTQIRVINAETGTVITYQANRDAIHGRAFTTLDGRQVTLADVERMEIVAPTP